MDNKNDISKSNKWKKMSVFYAWFIAISPNAAGITLDEHGWADVEKYWRS